MKLSEQLFIATESLLYAIVVCAVLYNDKDRVDITLQGIDNHQLQPDMNMIFSSSEKVAVKLHNFSTIAILIASVLTIIVRIMKIWQYERKQKFEMQTHNTPSTANNMDGIKDNIGLSFGSILPPLVFYVVAVHKRMDSDLGIDNNDIGGGGVGGGVSGVSRSDNHLPILQLYGALLSSVGISFACSTCMLTYQQWRITGINTHIRTCTRTSSIFISMTSTTTKKRIAENMNMTEKYSSAVDDPCGIRILRTTLSILPIFVSFTIYSILNAQDMDMDIKRDINQSNEIDGNIADSTITGPRLLQCIAIVFTVIESMQILLYCKGQLGSSHDRKESKSSVSASASVSVPSSLDNSKTSSNALQHVFSLGEWIVLSSFSSVILTDFIFRYVYRMDDTGQMDPSGQYTHTYTYSTKSLLSANGLPSEVVVSQSGLIGCIIGVAIGTNLFKLMEARNVSKVLSKNQKSQEQRRIFMHCATILGVTIISTVVSLHIALSKFCKDAAVNTDVPVDWCQNSSIPLQSLLPIRWLSWFLSDVDTNMSASYSMLLALGTQQVYVPRYVWLIYWVVTLFLCGPIALYLAQILYYSDNIKKKKKLTVAARKFFHFVAVALFTPVTAYSPKLMYLAYAIATALLVLVEGLRLAVQAHTTIEFSRRDKYNHYTKKVPVPPSSHKRRLGLNDFFETFYDEKDQRAQEGSFVVTHVALVIGCAAPLWINNVCSDLSLHATFIPPFIGIISLGIGDAFGAIIGTYFGKTRWPTSRRTVEGSLAMLLTMITCRIVLGSMFNNNNVFDALINPSTIVKETMFVYFPLTVLEAVTLQIDNFCLPIMGFVLSSL